MGRQELVARLSAALHLSAAGVARALGLLVDDGATVPFVARYRANETDAAPPDALRKIVAAAQADDDLQKRRARLVAALAKAGALSGDAEKRIAAADSKEEVDAVRNDLAPRSSAATLAQRARDDPTVGAAAAALADALWAETAPRASALACCATRRAAALILAERAAADGRARAAAQQQFEWRAWVTCAAVKETAKGSKATLKGAAAKDAVARGVFRDYVGYSKPLRHVSAHAWLAVHRGAEAGALAVSLSLDDDAAALRFVESALGLPGSRRGDCAALMKEAVGDAWKRLLKPRASREAKRLALASAKEAALQCFRDNLRALLLEPPLQLRRSESQRAVAVVVGVDPGYKHGHKVAVVRACDGAVVWHCVVRCADELADAVQNGAHLADAGGIVIAVGDGSNSAEAQRMAAHVAKRRNDENGECKYCVVRESGASVYSASPLAEAELSAVPLVTRAAVSLARRLLDPLSEYVKVEPAALGVGMYQADIDVKILKAALEGTAEDCVATVGVDVNAASLELLRRVAGLNVKTAAAIKARVDAKGPFKTRDDLKDVRGLGDRTFANVAGFLRLAPAQGKLAEALDATRVHPEAYKAAKALLRKAQIDSKALHDVSRRGGGFDAAAVERLRALEAGGEEALVDLLCDGCLAGDPRRFLRPPPQLRTGAPLALKDCRPRETTFDSAVVRNATPFGLFVDVGIGVDGLLHSSELRGRACAVGDVLRVVVATVDVSRKRLGLAFQEDVRGDARGHDARGHDARGRDARGATAAANEKTQRGAGLVKQSRRVEDPEARRAVATEEPPKTRRAVVDKPSKRRRPPDVDDAIIDLTATPAAPPASARKREIPKVFDLTESPGAEPHRPSRASRPAAPTASRAPAKKARASH
ncbi:hypothetical protein M885DRAFT_583962 [Pelagophyceae sp. CCMP2097]|nr:hypothetical protein M885DRAFT_583962 [Pelagophyceae sp. CCMP2097]